MTVAIWCRRVGVGKAGNPCTPPFHAPLKLKENSMTTAAIKSCMCVVTKPDSAAEFQDQTYGKGQRVHNVVTTTKGTESRCTVCGAKK